MPSSLLLHFSSSTPFFPLFLLLLLFTTPTTIVDAAPSVQVDKGTAVVFLKHEDPVLGLKGVVAAGDRMQESMYLGFQALEKHWGELYSQGKMTYDEAHRLMNMVSSRRVIMGPREDTRHHKIQYLRSKDGNAHFAIGFTGLNAVRLQFMNADKSDVKTMQDLADKLDASYRVALKQINVPVGQQQYLATNGEEIYRIAVGLPENKRAIVRQSVRNMDVEGHASHLLWARFEQAGYGAAEPAKKRLAHVRKDLDRHFMDHSRYMVDPTDPQRPHNSVSASYNAFALGPANRPNNFEAFWREDKEEIDRVKNAPEIPIENIVEQLIVRAAWNDAVVDDDLKEIAAEVMGKLRQRGWRGPAPPPYMPRTPPGTNGGRERQQQQQQLQESSSSQGNDDEKRKKKNKRSRGTSSSSSGSSSQNGRNEHVPPTPTKQSAWGGGRRRGKRRKGAHRGVASGRIEKGRKFG